jgi:hypothetical protein
VVGCAGDGCLLDPETFQVMFKRDANLKHHASPAVEMLVWLLSVPSFSCPSAAFPGTIRATRSPADFQLNTHIFEHTSAFQVLVRSLFLLVVFDEDFRILLPSLVFALQSGLIEQCVDLLR